MVKLCGMKYYVILHLVMYVHIKYAWHCKVEIAINYEFGPFCDAFNLQNNDPIFNIHRNIIITLTLVLGMPCLGFMTNVNIRQKEMG